MRRLPPEQSDRPCLRSIDSVSASDFSKVEWNCDNDHTGCLWNNGHNACSHPGDSTTPLEDTEGEGE
jgi:hypothetical protein